MDRGQLQHVVYEIGRRLQIEEVYVIGSAAILAKLPNPPQGELTATRDVDVIPPDDDQELAHAISFVLGEASPFDELNGYYAEGVTSETPKFAPHDWKSRAVAIQLEGIVARCMSPEDLVLSKLGAGREKDFGFARSLATLKILDLGLLVDLLERVECTPEERKLIANRIE